MKQIRAVLAVGLLVATILSGCVIVPVGGWEEEGGYRGHGGGWYYHSSPYHPYYHHDR